MAEIRDAAQTAADATYQRPQWMDPPCPPPGPDASEIAQRAIDMCLQSTTAHGRIGGLGWWQTANAYTAMALKDRWAGGGGGARANYDGLSARLRQCDARAGPGGLVNEFNDDSLWWALCCLHLYEVGGGADEWFLDRAAAVWRHVRDSGSVVGRGQLAFRGHDMEGGCFWKTTPSQGQINAISTGLYAECALRLALVELRRGTRGREDPVVRGYVEAARSGLGWVLRTRYRPRQGVVLDGFKIEVDTANDWTFTYTTGVALAVCALLYEITGEEELMHLAVHMASKGMRRDTWVEEDGVLTEKGAYGPGKSDPTKNNDSVGFKSVFVRQLGTLYDVIRRTQCQIPKAVRAANVIRQFVNINFRSQQERNTNGRAQYGPWWNGPFETPTSHSQMAVLDVVATAILVNR